MAYPRWVKLPGSQMCLVHSKGAHLQPTIGTLVKPVKQSNSHPNRVLPPSSHGADFVSALVRLICEWQRSPMVQRHAARAVAKRRSADPGHGVVLLEVLTASDLSSRAVCRWVLLQRLLPRPIPWRAAGSLRTFRLWRDAVPRGRGEVEHVLRKQLDEIVDNVPHGDDPSGPAMVVDQGNVLVVPHTHLVERVREFIVHVQAIRIGGHERPKLASQEQPPENVRLGFLSAWHNRILAAIGWSHANPRQCTTRCAPLDHAVTSSAT